MVVNGDKIIEEPLKEIRRVENYLGLPPFFNEDHFYKPDSNDFPCFSLGSGLRCMEKDKGLKHPPLKNETLEYLRKKFQPVVDQLEQETGVSLNSFMEKFE